MWENQFEEELQSLRIKGKFNELIFGILGASGILSIFAFYFVEWEITFRALLSMATLLLPASLFYLLLDYLHDRKQKRIEAELPQALLQIASFPSGAPIEKAIESLACEESTLGREFRKAHNMINAGFPTKEAIDAIAENNSSRLLKRSISLLLEAYENGGETITALSEIAEDISEMHSLMRESVAALSLQKYTLLGGAGVLVPLILAVLLGITSSLDFAAGDSVFGNGQANAGILPAAIASIHAYLFLLCVISSVFIAMQEGKLKKASVYFCMLFPCSTLIFGLLRGIQMF